MNVHSRDMLITQIIRGEASIPAEIADARGYDDPDHLSIRLISMLAFGHEAESIGRVARVASAMNPGHNLLSLIAQLCPLLDDPVIRRGWLASLASDDMQADIRRLQAAASVA